MKKLIALTLALLLALGCIGMAEGAADEKKKLIVGTNAEFEPFEFISEGEIVGFDPDLIELIMAIAGYEFEFISIEFDALLPALDSKQIDLAIAAMTINDERKESVLFSDPYFNASQKVVVLEGSDITEFAQLEGKKVGVQLGTTGDGMVTEKVNAAEVSRYNKALDAIMDLAAGRLDAVVTDAEPAKAYAAPYENLVILEENLSEEVYGIAATFENEALIAEINAALKLLIDEGYYTDLYDIWFGETEE